MPTQPARLTQDPHAVRDTREKSLEIAIGRQVRALRKAQNMTGSDLATAAGVSVGMLSKIENGVISPSLHSLQALSHALGVPLVGLFDGFEEPRGAMHVRAGDGVETHRAGTRAGHQYHLLGHIGASQSGVVVEPYMITLTSQSDRFPAFQHEGLEVLYMLEGTVGYRHADHVYRLEVGDTLIFDADAPHGPEELIDLPARYLSIISYPVK